MSHSRTILEQLEAGGINPTVQRIAVAEILLSRPQHLTAEQVHEQVNSSVRQVSVATVYNTLRLFVARGLIREVVVDPSRVYYDSTVGEHHHFYNVETGELTDIPEGAVDFSRLPQIPADSEMTGVDVVIRVKPRR